MLFSKACGFVKGVNWRKFREGAGACGRGPCMLLGQVEEMLGTGGQGRGELNIKYLAQAGAFEQKWKGLQFFLFVQPSAIIKIQFL